jgi:glycosyltransferase involved in cell wall biosynthesis
MSGNYCLISPCRDEAKYLRRTLDSVLAQTCPPRTWIIVDDGSTDETSDILAEYSATHDCLQVVSRDSATRRVGGGVVKAFNFGLSQIEPLTYDYVCKLDMDLDLPERYFEILIQRMEENPSLGTCSGKPYFPAKRNRSQSFGGPVVSEACGDDMSVGMTKFYRVECFEEIGGFVSEVMWDGIDCHRCRMLGWDAVSWDDPELRFLHLRPMGSSHNGIITGRMRHGFGQWFMGTSISYMAASAAYRMLRPPYVIGGAAMLAGYFKSMISGKPRYDDHEFRQFLRRYQRLCLSHGKQKAVELTRRPRKQQLSQPSVTSKAG